MPDPGLPPRSDEVVWLRESRCPSWCASGDHLRTASEEDRAHWGTFHEIELLLHEPSPMADGSTMPDRVVTVLEQGHDEPLPKVRQITAQGHDQLVLTLEEAAELGRTLLAVVEQAAHSVGHRSR